MKKRRFKIERINQLVQEYIKTSDDSIFERLLLEELVPIIGAQLGKKYVGVREFWDDIKQEVLLYLWKNRSTVRGIKYGIYYSWYWSIIRRRLHYIVTQKDGRNTRKEGYIMKLQRYDRMRDQTFYFKDLSDKTKDSLGILM